MHKCEITIDCETNRANLCTYNYGNTFFSKTEPRVGTNNIICKNCVDSPRNCLLDGRFDSEFIVGYSDGMHRVSDCYRYPITPQTVKGNLFRLFLMCDNDSNRVRKSVSIISDIR